MDEKILQKASREEVILMIKTALNEYRDDSRESYINPTKVAGLNERLQSIEQQVRDIKEIILRKK
jgi:hypothetical protein